MNLRTSVGKAIVAATLAGGSVLTTATPATASAPRYVHAYSNGVCDAATGEWAITWLLHNESDQDVTVSNVNSTPADRPIGDFPAVLSPGSTNATQRIPATPGLTASLNFSVTWADGTSQVVRWAFRPRILCRTAA